MESYSRKTASCRGSGSEAWIANRKLEDRITAQIVELKNVRDTLTAELNRTRIELREAQRRASSMIAPAERSTPPSPAKRNTSESKTMDDAHTSMNDRTSNFVEQRCKLSKIAPSDKEERYELVLSELRKMAVEDATTKLHTESVGFSAPTSTPGGKITGDIV